MTTTWEQIKNRPVKTITLDADGVELTVRGMLRSQKNELVAHSTNKKGDVDHVALEGRFLAYCVCESGTSNPVQPDFRMWADVPADFSSPLVKAVREVCGLDEDDLVRVAEKKSDTTGSSD